MPTPMSTRDRAFDQLSSEFPNVSVRVILAVFLTYLERDKSLASAVADSRARLKDACMV